jgi:hypothetical protein
VIREPWSTSSWRSAAPQPILPRGVCRPARTRRAVGRRT